MKKVVCSILFLFVTLSAVLAQSSYTANTLRLDDPAKMPAATLEDVAWLSGAWQGEGLGGVVEEVWSEPLGGAMMCMFRLIQDDQIVFYELVSLVEESGSLVMKIKHFNADFSAWEEKADFVRFPLVRLEENTAYFDGLTYRRVGGDTLKSFVVLGQKNGAATEAAFSFHLKEKADASMPDLRVYGVKIKVPDMEIALKFYHETLGFEIASRLDYPKSVTLKNDGITLILSLTDRSKKINYPHEEQTVLVFQANNLNETIARWQARGVEFLLKEPLKVGVGVATKFRDPFGNVHSLLEQQVGETPFFAEPQIYNVGFYLNDLAAARRFYHKQLGFVVRTDQYYPALPLGHRDGTFAFMLHGKEGLGKSNIDYRRDAQTVILYETANISATLARLRENGVAVLHQSPQTSPQGRYIAFRNPAGLVSEIIERQPARASID